uniref:hypothetical protein n=1 Tax=Goniotrichopsis reniformis TaxID=468933 RepID=UPI001FCD1897|nr:hypothetical protein MW428_pgp049 [Goniotrichopsis reniformis]UNJ14849.1 hypothetical protein [Goniotrichopsis reniformis]
MTPVMIQNLDILLLTVEALDFSVTQSISSYQYINNKYSFPYLSSFEVLQLRCNNQLRTKCQRNSISIYKLIDLIYILQIIVSRESTLSFIKILINSQLYLEDKSWVTKFFIRFNFLFRKYINEKAINIQKYSNDKYLKQVALLNIYILFLLKEKNGYEYFWSYLSQYNFLEYN